MCYGCIAWCSRGIPTVGAGADSDSLACLWDPVPPIWLPHPALVGWNTPGVAC